MRNFLARKHTVEISMSCRYAELYFVHTSCNALRAFVLRAEASETEKFLMYIKKELQKQYTSMAQKIQRLATRKIKTNN